MFENFKNAGPNIKMVLEQSEGCSFKWHIEMHLETISKSLICVVEIYQDKKKVKLIGKHRWEHL